jgi:hypothetical protein
MPHHAAHEAHSALPLRPLTHNIPGDSGIHSAPIRPFRSP